MCGVGRFWGQAAGRDRLLWKDAKCFRDRLLCCLGTGCMCGVDRFWGQAAGRDRLLGGTGCWEDAKCFRDRLLCCLGTGCWE